MILGVDQGRDQVSGCASEYRFPLLVYCQSIVYVSIIAPASLIVYYVVSEVRGDTWVGGKAGLSLLKLRLS